MFGPYFGDHMGSDYFAAGPSAGAVIPAFVPVERQIARIRIGGTTVGIVIIDRELADVLSDAGYNWQDYNHLRWPIGAARHASGKFLFHASGIEKLRAAGIHDATFELQIGDSSAPTTISNLMALPLEPLFVSTRGARDEVDASESVRLYALPIVDTRFHLARNPAAANYNLLGADRETFNEETIDGPDDPFTYDEIGAILAASAGLTWTPASGATRSTHPFDMRVQGTSAAVALDRMLAESGRVFVVGVDGVHAVENVDQRQGSQVLTTVRERILTGGVRYATPTSIGDTFLNEVSPLAVWASQEVPVQVAISMPTLDGTTPANDPTVKRIIATNNAATFSLSSGLDTTRDIPDSMPVLDPDAPSEAELARVELRAEEFYRRYVAGAMDVWCAGIVVPSLGGSCQEITWFFDNIRGARTRLVSRFDLDLLGDDAPPPMVNAGRGIQIVRRPGGDVETRLIDGVDVKAGRITQASVDVDSLPPVARYKCISNDGSWETVVLARPIYRPYNDIPLISPAIVGSNCLVARINNVVALWSCDERLTFEIKVGTITENTANGIDPLNPSDALYKAISNDGAWVVDDFSRPLYRPYNDSPLVLAAIVGSICIIVLVDDVVTLWSCDERIDFEICDANQGTAFNNTVDMGSDHWIVGQLRTVQTSPEGNIVVEAGRALSGNPENLVIVDPEGEPVSDPSGNLIIEDSPDVADDFYDRIIIDQNGDVVTGEDDEVVIEWDGVEIVSGPVAGA